MITIGGRPSAGRSCLTFAMTLGFVAVFGIFGLVIAPVASGVEAYLPWVTVLIGVIVVLLGVWLLSGRSLPTFGWSPTRTGGGGVPRDRAQPRS